MESGNVKDISMVTETKMRSQEPVNRTIMSRVKKKHKNTMSKCVVEEWKGVSYSYFS